MPNGKEICACGKTPIMETNRDGFWRVWCIHCKTYGPWRPGAFDALRDWRDMKVENAEDLI